MPPGVKLRNSLIFTVYVYIAYDCYNEELLSP